MLAILMLLTCALTVSCGKEEEGEDTSAATDASASPTDGVVRSFLAAYEKAAAEAEEEPADEATPGTGDNDIKGEPMGESGRALLNLWADGKLDGYVGVANADGHKMAKYEGTYTLGENEDFDETISFSYTCEGETVSVENAVIIDGVFSASFEFLPEVAMDELKFYETAPAATDGDVYVGYLTKTGGMGSMVYAYSLCIQGDGNFKVSIMQLASVMHVLGESVGTYTVDGNNVTFTYDVSDGEGGIAVEDYVSKATRVTEAELSAGFNIAQTSVAASNAKFIRVK